MLYPAHPAHSSGYEIAIFGKIAQSFLQSRPPLISHFRQLETAPFGGKKYEQHEERFIGKAADVVSCSFP